MAGERRRFGDDLDLVLGRKRPIVMGIVLDSIDDQLLMIFLSEKTISNHEDEEEISCAGKLRSFVKSALAWK
jgi:hypothetical protein